MTLHNLDPKQVSSFVRAFEALTVEGKLLLNGKIAGICEAEQIGGHMLRNHPQLYKFLKPTPSAEELERDVIGRMSADEYKKSRPELQESVPWLIKQRWVKIFDSFVSLHPEYLPTPNNRDLILKYMVDHDVLMGFNGIEATYRALLAEGKLETRENAVIP